MKTRQQCLTGRGLGPTLLAIAALCAGCSPVRQQIESNPGGYIVASYSHEGATDGDGSQVFAMRTNPVGNGVEAGTAFLESENGDGFALASQPTRSGFDAFGPNAYNRGPWLPLSGRHGSLFLNGNGTFNNHLIVLSPPPRPAPSTMGNVNSRPPSAASRPSRPSRSSLPSARPASAIPRTRSNGASGSTYTSRPQSSKR